MSIKDKVIQAISDCNMLQSGDSVVVALSGGADSVALLYMLKTLENELDIIISACHINHHLRGAESDSDMNYCRLLCEKLNVPLTIYDVDIPAAQQKHESTEECARKLRYQRFAEISAGKKLATAHNCNDNTETLLLNLMRGTGLKGLCGIPPVRGNIIRPLIYCTRDEIEQCCKDNMLHFVVDSTNLSTDYTRNKVRHLLLPEMLKINGSLHATVTRTVRSLREDSEFLENMASESLNAARMGNGYSAAELAKLPKPILNRAVKRILNDGGIEPSALRIDTAVELIIKGKGQFNPCKGKFFAVKKGIAFVFEQEQIYKKHMNK